MNGSFNPESFDNKAANADTFVDIKFEELTLDRKKEDIDAFFGKQIGSAQTLTGGQYFRIFQEGTKEGFSQEELANYLKEHGIKVQSAS